MVTRRELLIGGGAVVAASAVSLPLILEPPAPVPHKYPPLRVERWDWKPGTNRYGDKTYHVWTAEQDDAWIDTHIRPRILCEFPKRSIAFLDRNGRHTYQTAQLFAVTLAEMNDGMAILNMEPLLVDYSRAIAYSPHAYNPV